MAHAQLPITKRASRQHAWIVTASGVALALAAALAPAAHADVSPECAAPQVPGKWSYRCLQEQQGITPGSDYTQPPPPSSVEPPPPGGG
jgi:hypothetical protein